MECEIYWTQDNEKLGEINIMNEKNIILKVRNLSTSFLSDNKEINIVKNVSFDVKRGKALAIVGESGCGKSVTMNSILKLLGRNAKTDADEITFYEKQSNGTIKPHYINKIKKQNGKEMNYLRGQKISMVFQDPMSSLDPVYRVGDQVMEGLREHCKISKKEAKKKTIEIFKKLGIPDAEKRVNCYPYEFSGGMKQRVVIAIALICNPDLIICDEPTTALDVTIQAQIMDILKELQEQLGISIVLITHNMGLVAQMASDVVVMYMGRIVEKGTREEIFLNPRHPYTQALLKSVPVLGMANDKKLETIPGITPNPADLKEGCEFADRCTYCKNECRTGKISLYKENENHSVRCLLYKERGWDCETN